MTTGLNASESRQSRMLFAQLAMCGGAAQVAEAMARLRSSRGGAMDMQSFGDPRQGEAVRAQSGRVHRARDDYCMSKGSSERSDSTQFGSLTGKV